MLHLYCQTVRRREAVDGFRAVRALADHSRGSNQKTARTFCVLCCSIKSEVSDSEVNIIEGDPNDSIAVATTISSPLHDFQGALLEGKESFHHAGIHIHSKIIMVDPFGSDPIIVTGSANFSNNSTEVNDSNSMILRGFTSVADIYATEFMRMFEHYHFRSKEAKAQDKSKPLGLAKTIAGRTNITLREATRKKTAGCLPERIRLFIRRNNMSSKVFGSYFLFAVFLISALSSNAFAWGNEGHHITVRIAANYLDPLARIEVIKLLREDAKNNEPYYRQNCPKVFALTERKMLSASEADALLSDGLACVASWADPPVKRQRNYTSNWHFVDIPVIFAASPPTRFTYDAARDCRTDARSGDCAIQALERFQPVLANYKNSAVEDHEFGEELTVRAEAMKFFVHIIGDIHQPLHCVTDKKDKAAVSNPKDVGDMGGNLKYATWFGEANTPYGAMNLHSIWDGGFIERTMQNNNWTEIQYAQKLIDGIDAEKSKMAAMQKGDYLSWTAESYDLAIESGYGKLPKIDPACRINYKDFQRKRKGRQRLLPTRRCLLQRE